MADIKISNLANLAAAADDDELVIVDISVGITKKIEALDLVNTAHTHDGETLQIDGINSNGGAFPFTTSGAIAFSHGQLGFPAGANPSADPNTLDDYEEGTWTFDLTFSGLKVGITYDAGYTTGYYTKIGNVVTVSGYMILTSKGSSNGNTRLGGLPFACVDNTAAFAAAAISLASVTFANQYYAFVEVNKSYITILEVTEGGTETDITDANFANNSRIRIGATYRAQF